MTRAKQSVAPKAPPAEAAPSSDLDVLRAMVGLLDSSTATTIKLQRGDASYEVAKGAMAAAPMMVPGPPAAAPSPAAPPTPPAASAAPSNLIEIKSPMVGTYYRSPEPGAEPYVKPGSRVTTGQTLCIIEAMKIMNEIESELSGTVRDVAVEDGQPVEFGQVLFRVEPNV